MDAHRLNLPAIEDSLNNVQQNFDTINNRLSDRRDPLTDEVVSYMMSGYRYVDQLLAESIDPFSNGQSKHLLEINRHVLCGEDEDLVRCQKKQLKATSKAFYSQGGIEDIVEWLAGHGDDPAWKRAAGVFVRVMSQPQLFIEGNHRTGALLMTYLLASDGKPPFVLTVDNALAYFEPASLIRKRRKRGLDELLRLPRMTSKLAAMLEKHADRTYLKN